MNYLDTRDLYKRQEELKWELEGLQSLLEEAGEQYTEACDALQYDKTADAVEAKDEAEIALQEATSALADWQEENQAELDELNALEREVGREWMHGETLIPESEFVSYTQELADIIGATAGDGSSWLVIDGEATAEGLKQDYSEAEFQGTTYLFRAN